MFVTHIHNTHMILYTQTHYMSAHMHILEYNNMHKYSHMPTNLHISMHT